MIFSLKNTTFYLIILYVVYRGTLCFSYTLDLGGIEQNVVFTITNFFNGNSIYGDPESGNYSITQYSPILYLLNIMFDFLIGVKSSFDVHKIYVVGRGLSLIFNLSSLIVFYKLLSYKLSVNKEIAFSLSVLMFFSLTRFHFSIRPDGLYNLVFLLFIYNSVDFILGDLKKEKIFYSSFFLVLLFLVKQSAIQIIPILPLFLLFRRRYNDFYIFSLYFVLLISFTLISCYVLLGEYFFVNILGGIKNQVSLNNAIELLLNYFSENSTLLVMMFASFYFMCNTPKKVKPEIVQFIFFSTILTFLTSFLLTFKVGAGVNYYNEFGVLSLALFGLIFSEKLFSFRKNLIFVVLLISSLYFVRSFYHDHSVDLKNTNNKALWTGQKEFVSGIASILTDDSKVLSFDMKVDILIPELVVVPNKDIVPLQSSFDYSFLFEEYKKGKIEYIIQDQTSSRKQFMGLNFQNYIPVFSHKNLVLLKRNDEE